VAAEPTSPPSKPYGRSRATCWPRNWPGIIACGPFVGFAFLSSLWPVCPVACWSGSQHRSVSPEAEAGRGSGRGGKRTAGKHTGRREGKRRDKAGRRATTRNAGAVATDALPGHQHRRPESKERPSGGRQQCRASQQDNHARGQAVRIIVCHARIERLRGVVSGGFDCSKGQSGACSSRAPI
jgi:hypothetical protein